MNFNPQIHYTLPSGVPIPYFMTYSGYQAPGMESRQNERMYRDFEYLRETCPGKVRKYRQRVEEILDKMDYEGSMIYDEYPDRLSLQSLGLAVAKALAVEDGSKSIGEAADVLEDGTLRSLADDASKPRADDETFRALITILVCEEIYRRRQKPNKFF